MKGKFIFTAIIATVLCMGAAKSQITPITQKTSLAVDAKAIVDRSISEYTAFKMDKKELVKLHRNGGGSFRLRVDENIDWLFELELNDMRSPNYKATYTTDEGVFDIKEPFVVNTFKGKTSEGHEARFTIDENNFYGVIFYDTYHYVVRPTKDYTQNVKDDSFVVYNSRDIIYYETPDYINDALEVPDNGINHDIGIPYSPPSSRSCAYYNLNIATDADFQYHSVVGSNVAFTNYLILGYLNISEGVYQSTFQIKLITGVPPKPQ